MAKRAFTPTRWLSNSRFVSLEAILLVGLLESLLEDHVMALAISKPLKILFVMLFIAGAFGILMSVVVLLTKRSLGKGQKVLTLLPVPHLVVHLAALAGIFWLYYNYY